MPNSVIMRRSVTVPFGSFEEGSVVTGYSQSQLNLLIESGSALPIESAEGGELVRATRGPGGGIEVCVGDISATIPELTAAQSAATLASATAALTPILTDEREYIQGYYVQVGGTRTTGRSTPGDWSAANCYGAIQAALNQGWTSDDWIVLDDGDWSITVLSMLTTTALTGAAMRIRSRSMNRELCSLRFTDSAAAGFRFNRADRVYGLDVRGIRFSAVTHTTTPPVFLQVSEPSADEMLFEDVDFYDAAIDHPALVSLHGFFNIATSAKALARTVTFRRVRFYGLFTRVLAGSWFISGLAGSKVVFDDCDFGVEGEGGIEAIATAPASGFSGGFDSGIDVEVNNCRQYGVSITHQAVSDVACFPLLTVGGTLVVDGFEVRNSTVSGAAAGTFGILAQGPYTIKGVYGEDCVSTPAPTINSVGGLVTVFGEAATGTAQNIVAVRCKSDFGTAYYWSQGATGTVKSVVAQNCEARVNSIVYSGGWGDTEAIGIVGIDCITGTGSAHPSDGSSGFLHAHNHTSLATREKTAKYKHVRLVNCRNGDAETDGADTLYAHSMNATYGMTLELQDIVADGAPGKHISLAQANGNTFTVSGDVAIPGGAASVTTEGTITGGLNVTGNVQGFPRKPTLDEAIAWARHAAGI